MIIHKENFLKYLLLFSNHSLETIRFLTQQTVNIYKFIFKITLSFNTNTSKTIFFKAELRLNKENCFVQII
jgi:hypothetical protein